MNDQPVTDHDQAPQLYAHLEEGDAARDVATWCAEKTGDGTTLAAAASEAAPVTDVVTVVAEVVVVTDGVEVAGKEVVTHCSRRGGSLPCWMSLMPCCRRLMWPTCVEGRQCDAYQNVEIRDCIMAHYGRAATSATFFIRNNFDFETGVIYV